MKRLFLTLTLLLLTSCIAPDGSTVTVATIDEDGVAQVRAVEVTGVEEFYRGLFSMCIYATATQNGGYVDDAGCHELTAHAYDNDEYSNEVMRGFWDWDLVQQEID